MSYLGDYAPTSSVVFNFTTAVFGTPTTLSGSPAISIYKNSLTESTTGVTLTVDYDSRTGLNHVVVDTSADGTFYAAGNDFTAVITAGNISTVTAIGNVVGEFSLNDRSALRPATAGRTINVDASGRALSDLDTIKTNPVVNAGTVTFPTTATLASTTNITAGTITTTTNLTTNNDKTGYSLSSPQTVNFTGNITGNLSGSVGSVTGAVGSVTGAVGSVTGNVGGNVVGSVASVTGNVGGNVVGSVASVTGNVGGNVVGSVGSVTGLTASNLDTTVSSRATPAQVNAEVVDALATDTYAEPGQGTPAATTSLAAKINYLFKNWRNKKTQTSSEFDLYSDDETTVDQKSATSDNGTTFTRDEITSGP